MKIGINAVLYEEFFETKKCCDIEQCPNIYEMMVQKLEQIVKKCTAKWTDTTTDFRFYSTVIQF
jgi:hypothetical protein